MFEVGFTEILLIMVIALVVLGPEKLPKLAADVGRWMGRARSMARQLRTQLDQEVQLDDMLKEQKSATPPAATAAGHETSADPYTPPAYTPPVWANPPAAGPDAPAVGAPTDDLHSHGPAHDAATVVATNDATSAVSNGAGTASPPAWDDPSPAPTSVVGAHVTPPPAAPPASTDPQHDGERRT